MDCFWFKNAAHTGIILSHTVIPGSHPLYFAVGLNILKLNFPQVLAFPQHLSLFLFLTFAPMLLFLN